MTLSIGANMLEMTFSDGQVSQVGVYIPSGYVKGQPQKWGVWCHAGGNNGYIIVNNPYYTVQAESHNMIILGFDGRLNGVYSHDWVDTDLMVNKHLEDGIAWARETLELYDYLPCLFGNSMGGAKTIYELVNHPDRYSAFATTVAPADYLQWYEDNQWPYNYAPFGGTWTSVDPVIHARWLRISPAKYLGTADLKGRKLFATYGEADTLVWASTIGAEVNANLPLANNAGFHVVPGLGHVDTNNDYTPVIFDLFNTESRLISAINIVVSSDIYINTNIQLQALATVSDGVASDLTSAVTWSSSNPSIATVDKNGILSPLMDGLTTITATFGSMSDTSVLTVKEIPQLTINTVTSNDVSFGTFDLGSIGNKIVGYLKFLYLESGDAVTLKYSTDQINWTNIELSGILNNEYCKINLFSNNQIYYFQFSLLRNSTYFYSEIVNSNSFYLSSVFNLSYIKEALINQFWLTVNIQNIYSVDLINFQYSTDQLTWINLDLNYINNNSTFRSLFDVVGKSGVYYYRVKLVRLDETYYSDVGSFNLDDMVERNVLNFNPFLPKSPVNYTNSRFSVPKLGSVRMGYIRKTPASNSVYGSFILGQRVLGSFVTIDIRINTTATFTRYYSCLISNEQAFDLYQYYTCQINMDVPFNLGKVNEIIRLVSSIQTDISLEANMIKNISMKAIINPNISLESNISEDVSLKSNVMYQIDIEANV